MSLSAAKFGNMMRSNLAKRLISAVIMALVCGLCLLLGGIYFQVMVAFLALAMMFELMQLAGRCWRQLSFYHIAVVLGGAAYISLSLISLLWLRDQPNGLYWTAALVLMVIATDLGGYIVGRLVGGPKLMPRISPNKTISGLAGAMIFSAIVGFIMLGQGGLGMMIGAAIGFIAQAGDLLESMIKRRAGAKDSGTLIPGHGGVLDRMDGYLAALPSFVIFYQLLLI
ncbi:MAG: phosphatidate cytidylyltransferase [Alphaproteobacteria bacterium]